MRSELPTPVREYFASRNALDADAALAQFGDDAFVEDEDVQHRGRGPIGEWIKETQAKYHPQFEVQGAERIGNRLTVSVLVSGNFPGSPLAIHHAFEILDEKIVRMVIG